MLSDQNMFKEYSNSAEAGSTHQKTKNIHKQRNQVRGMEQSRQNLTRAQKLLLQKQRNRIAAQASRDKQKKYVAELEDQIRQLKDVVDQQICSNCGVSIRAKESHSLDDFLDPIGTIGDQLPFISQDSESKASAVFFRESNSSSRYYNMGTYLMILFLVMAAGSFMCCLQSEKPSVRLTGRIMQQCLPFQILEGTEDAEQRSLEEQSVVVKQGMEIVNQPIEMVQQEIEMTKQDIKVDDNNFKTTFSLIEPSLWNKPPILYINQQISCIPPQIIKKQTNTDYTWTVGWSNYSQMLTIYYIYQLASLSWFQDLSLITIECFEIKQ